MKPTECIRLDWKLIKITEVNIHVNILDHSFIIIFLFDIKEALHYINIPKAAKKLWWMFDRVQLDQCRRKLEEF